MDDANLAYFKAVFETITAIIGFLVLAVKLIVDRKKGAAMLVFKMTKVEASPV
jgi:hypothetical protein